MTFGRSVPVEEDDFDVNVFAILVQEILEEVGHGFVGDVAADDNMPERIT